MMSAMETARKVQDKLAQLQKTFECPICLELMKNPVSTKCDHKFCRHCLLSTIGKKTSAPCPLCKENFTKRSLQSLPKWNELVTTIEKLVLAYQQDTGEQFSPPKGPPLPVSQSTQESKANRKKRARCRRRTNFDEVDSQTESKQTSSTSGRKRKAEEEVIIYIEDAEDLGEDPKPQLVLKSNTNISPSFCLGAPSKKRKSSERKHLQMGGEENQTLLPSRANVPRSEDVVAYLTSASFTQKSPDLSVAKKTGEDGKKLTIAVPRSMTKDLCCDSSKQVHQTKPKGRNTRRAKRKESKDEEKFFESDIQINLLSEVETDRDKPIDLTPEETIAERIKRNSIKRGTASKLATEAAQSNPGQGKGQKKIQSPSEIDSEDDSKPVGKLRSKLKKICSLTCESRATKSSQRKADVVNYLMTAPTAGLCGMSQGKVEPETRMPKPKTRQEEERKKSKETVSGAPDTGQSQSKDQHPECRPVTKNKVEKWLAAAPDSVSPLMSDNSKTLTVVTEGVDCESIPSQAVGHELELCLEQMAEAEMVEDGAAETAEEEVYPDEDDDDDDAGLIVRTDDDDEGGDDAANEDVDENSSQEDCYDSIPANPHTVNSDHVFGPLTAEEDITTTETETDEDDISQEDQDSVAGSRTRRIFKARYSIQLQSPQKAKYKVIGTPNSDDPYAFKPSQKTPKTKPKKGRRAREKQRKKKQLKMQNEANVDSKKEPSTEKKNKPIEKQSKMKKKREQLQQQEEDSERTSQQIDAMVQKISEAEDFELMMSQQYREMVASAKKEKRQERQKKDQSVKTTNVVTANETPTHNSTNSASSSEEPIPGTAQSEGRKLQSALSRGRSSIIKKRVTISCVTQEDREITGIDANRRHSAAGIISDKENRRPVSEPAAVAQENILEDSGRETPFKTLSQGSINPLIIQETPLVGKSLKACSKNLDKEERNQSQMESVAVAVDDTAGESLHKIPVPKIDANQAWKSARKMSHELGPKTKKLQMVQSQKPQKRSSLSADQRKKAVEPPPLFDTSTEDDVTIQEVMSEVRGHEVVTSPGEAQSVSQNDSSDTESLDSPHSSPQQFEPANLDIQPESVKKKLSKSLQDSEGQSPPHPTEDQSFQEITVEVVPGNELKKLLTPKNKKRKKEKRPVDSDADGDEDVSWQEPLCASGSEREKGLSQKKKKKKKRDSMENMTVLSTLEKSSVKGSQEERQTEEGLASQARKQKRRPADSDADEDEDVPWQEPLCASGSEGGKKKKKKRDSREKMALLSTPEKSSVKGSQEERPTEGGLTSKAHNTSIVEGPEKPGSSTLSSGRSGQGSGRRTFSLTLSPNKRLPRPEPVSLEMRNAIEEALELMEEGNGAIDPANKELYESVLRSAKKRGKRSKRAARKSVPMTQLETEEQKHAESNGEEDVLVITEKESIEQQPVNQSPPDSAPHLMSSDQIGRTDKESADLPLEDAQTVSEDSTIISATTGASDAKMSAIIPVPNFLEMPRRKQVSRKSDPSGGDTSSHSSNLETESDRKRARKSKKQKQLEEKVLEDEAVESQEGDSAPIPDTWKASKKKLARKERSNRTSSLDSKRSSEKSQAMTMASLESECSISLLCPNPETVTSQSGKKTLKRSRREKSSSEEDEEEQNKPEQKRLSGEKSRRRGTSTDNSLETSDSQRKRTSRKSRKSYVSSDTEAETISDYQEVETAAARVCPPCESLEPSDFVPPTPQGDKPDTSLTKKKISPQASVLNASKPHRVSTSPTNVTAKLISEDVDDESNFLNIASPHSSTKKFKKKLIRPRIASCESGIASQKTSSQSQLSVSLLQPVTLAEKPSHQFENHSQDRSLQMDRDSSPEKIKPSTKKRTRHEDQDNLSSNNSHSNRMTLVVPKDATPIRKNLHPKPAPTTPSQPINLAADDDDDVLDEEQIVGKILRSKRKSRTPCLTVESDVDDISLSPDVTAVEEPETSDEEENIVHSSRHKKRKKAVIEDDSDDSDNGDTTACQTMNMTSSSAFSTQSELLSTQAKQDLQHDVKSIEDEIAQLEAQLAATKSPKQLPRGNDSVDSYATAPSQSPRRDKRSRRQETRNQITDAGEDSDEDLFGTPDQEVSASPQPSMPVSVASPSPPPSGLPSVLTSPSKQPPELQEARRVLEELRSKTASQLSEDSLESTAGSKTKRKLENEVDDFENYSIKKQSAAKIKHRKVAVLRVSPAVNVDVRRAKHDSVKVSPRSTSSNSFRRSDSSSLLSGGKMPSRPDWVFVTSGISKLLQKPYVEKLCKLLGCKMVSQYSTAVTHVLVKPSEEGSLKCSRTLKYFQGIAGQKFVLSVQWAIDCIKEKTLLNETPYEIIEDTVEEGHYGPRKSRESTSPLLSAYEICCYGDFEDLSAEDLRDLVQSCGGKVASDPETFRSTKRAHKLIVVEANHVDVMPELKKLHKYQGLPIITKEWLLDSIGAYDVKPIEDYVVYG